MRNRYGLGTLVGFGAILLGIVSAGCESTDPTPEAPSVRTGTLVTTLSQTASDKTVTRYYLSENGKWTPLSVSAPVTVKPNTQVRVTGTLAADGRTIQAQDIVPDSTAGKSKAALSETAAAGTIAVLLIKQTGAPDPYPAAEARATLFGNADSTDAFFNEVSRNKFRISGEVFGWYEADINNCDADWESLDSAMAAAVNDGFVTANYRHAIGLIGVPEGGKDCGIAWGTVGRPDGTGVVVSRWNNSNTFAHELGHNIGLTHAGSSTCRDSGLNIVPFSANCDLESYNDPFDGMGYQGHYYHFNSYSKRLLNWIPEAKQALVTESGDFDLVAQERAASGLQGLYIPMAGTDDALHVEVREKFGFDKEDRFSNAVLVRHVKQTGLGQETFLVDMTPEDQDRSNAGLVVGQTYHDPMSGVAITLTAQQGNRANIHVAFGGISCRDGAKNGTETDVDCGGICGACSAGQGCSLSNDCSTLACTDGTCVDSSGGWTGEYYSDMDFSTLAASRTDAAIKFNWKDSAPMGSVPKDKFAARWTGTVTPPTSELYTFFGDMDDGVRVWVDDQLIIDRWSYDSNPAQGQISLTAGKEYRVRVDFFDSGGAARANLLWSTPTRPRDIVSPLYVTSGGAASCTLASAKDLGARSSSSTITNDACIKISQFPDWWNWGSQKTTLQAQWGNGFPVSLNWEDTCTGEKGSSSIAAAYQSAGVGQHTRVCPVVIKLGGDGSSTISVTWY